MKTFKAAQSTSASRETVWQIWMDVANWHVWDTELISAHSTSSGQTESPTPLTLNSTGTLKPKQGPESTFTITEFTDGKNFTFRTKLPFATLDVAHYFTDAAQTTFVHQVTFGGPMAWLFSRILGKTFAKALPDVLKRIQQLAEQR